MNEINLLPPELRQDLPLDWKELLPFVLVCGLITLALTICLVFWGLNLLLAKQSAGLDYQLVQLQPKIKQAEVVQANILKLENQKKQMKTILENRKNWSRILGNINDILPQDVWLTSLKVNEEGKLLLKGTVQELTSVGILVFELNKLPYFTKAELVKAETLTGIITFEVTAELEKGSEN